MWMRQQLASSICEGWTNEFPHMKRFESVHGDGGKIGMWSSILSQDSED